MPLGPDDPTPNPEATPPVRELFSRIVALERKFDRLHDAVAKFTSDATEEMDDVNKRFDGFASDLADLRREFDALKRDLVEMGQCVAELTREVRRGHAENNGLLQGLARAFERIETKMSARLAAP